MNTSQSTDHADGTDEEGNDDEADSNKDDDEEEDKLDTNTKVSADEKESDYEVAAEAVREEDDKGKPRNQKRVVCLHLCIDCNLCINRINLITII